MDGYLSYTESERQQMSIGQLIYILRQLSLNSRGSHDQIYNGPWNFRLATPNLNVMNLNTKAIVFIYCLPTGNGGLN